MRLRFFMVLFFSVISLISVSYSSENFSDNLIKKNDNSVNLDQYWTPERLKNAKPTPLPEVNPKYLLEQPSPLHYKSVIKPGYPPTIHLTPDQGKIILNNQKTFQNQKINPTEQGTARYPFTSTRLIPLSADLSYPYSTTGKLFYTKPGVGSFVCSASVIAPRIVLTAGHCVHGGKGGSYYTNWYFIPAFRDGSAPLQTWTWSSVLATSAWISQGGFPNPSDFALLEFRDNVISGVPRKLGSVTGVLGFATQKIIPNHLHVLGYSCTHDSCNKMHEVTTQVAKLVAFNNGEYGSDMTGGSSGGPLIQNFGQPAAGQRAGQNPGFNQAVGVVSWGYTTFPEMMVQGSSNMDSQFTNIYSQICARQSGNC